MNKLHKSIGSGFLLVISYAVFLFGRRHYILLEGTIFIKEVRFILDSGHTPIIYIHGQLFQIYTGSVLTIVNYPIANIPTIMMMDFIITCSLISLSMVSFLKGLRNYILALMVFFIPLISPILASRALGFSHTSLSILLMVFSILCFYKYLITSKQNIAILTGIFTFAAIMSHSTWSVFLALVFFIIVAIKNFQNNIKNMVPFIIISIAYIVRYHIYESDSRIYYFISTLNLLMNRVLGPGQFTTANRYGGGSAGGGGSGIINYILEWGVLIIAGISIPRWPFYNLGILVTVLIAVIANIKSLKALYMGRDNTINQVILALSLTFAPIVVLLLITGDPTAAFRATILPGIFVTAGLLSLKNNNQYIKYAIILLIIVGALSTGINLNQNDVNKKYYNELDTSTAEWISEYCVDGSPITTQSDILELTRQIHQNTCQLRFGESNKAPALYRPTIYDNSMTDN